MRKRYIIISLILGLLTFVAKSASAQQPVMFGFKFNAIVNPKNPNNPRYLGDCNLSVRLRDVPEGWTRDSNNSDILIINPCEEYSYFYLLAAIVYYSNRENYIRFYQENHLDISFTFIKNDSQVGLHEKGVVNGRKYEKLYVQTNEKYQKDNLKLFNMLMDEANNHNFNRYIPIPDDD